MTTKRHTTNETARFEDVYPRAPFSELIRLVLMATDAVVGHLGRPSPRGAAAAGHSDR